MHVVVHVVEGGASGQPEPPLGPTASRHAPSPSAILVVEDDPDLLPTMRDMRARIGHPMVTARSGEDALTQFAQADFAVVVIDLAVPGHAIPDIIRPA